MLLVDPHFVDHCSAYARNQKVAPEIACQVERVTRGQSNNALWLSLHNGRITSSRFREIFVRKATTPPDKLVISLIGYQSPLAATNLPPQIEWVKHVKLLLDRITLQLFRDEVTKL